MAHHNEKADAGSAYDPSAREKKLVAYEIAEDAKAQIVVWAKWIIGASLAVAATLSIKTCTDIQNAIKHASDNQIKRAQESSDTAIARFEAAQESELEDFRKRSRKAVAEFESEMETVLNNVRAAGEQAEAAILSAASTQSERDTPTPRTVDRRGRLRPIGPGISISGSKTTGATLCCIVENAAGERFLLSASFVAELHATIIQPAAVDGGRKVTRLPRLST